MRFLFALMALSLFLTGCRNQADAGEELDYIRAEPDKYSPENVSPKDLLPLKPGGHWEYVVQRSKGDPSREITSVIGGTGSQAFLESREKEKIVSRDQYKVNDRGIWVSAVMIDGVMMPIAPSIPLIRFPIQEEKVTSWQGTVGSGKTTMTGLIWTRVTRRQKVKTPAGEFLAYRVDMRSEISGGNRSSALLASRWFVPGVGIVRVRAIDSKSVVVKELLPQKKPNSSATNRVK